MQEAKNKGLFTQLWHMGSLAAIRGLIMEIRKTSFICNSSQHRIPVTAMQRLGARPLTGIEGNPDEMNAGILKRWYMDCRFLFEQ